MENKNNKFIWIILAVIVVLIGALSLSTCLKTKTKVDYSEFIQLVQFAEDNKNNGEISREQIESIASSNGNSVIKTNLSNSSFKNFVLSEVVIKNYNIDFAIKVNGNSVKTFTTNFSRLDCM